MHHVGTAKTRQERRAHMSPAEFLGTRSGMVRWPCSALLHFDRGPIFGLGQCHDRLFLQRV